MNIVFFFVCIKCSGICWMVHSECRYNYILYIQHEKLKYYAWMVDDDIEWYTRFIHMHALLQK